jgi:aspartate racemase
MHLSYPRDYSDRTEFLLGKTDINPADAFVKVLRSMERQGVDVAAIICNTAHASSIIGEIRSQLLNSSLIYINIIEETQKRIEKDGLKKVGLLATTGTCKFGLYKNGFSGELITPVQADQKRVHNCIYHVDYGLKVHYPKVKEFLYDELEEIGNRLVKNGAEALVLGCTELPLLKELKNRFDVPVYDPNQILAESLMTEAKAISALKQKPQLIQNIS